MRRERVQDLFLHMEWADSLVWAETLRRQETASNGRIRELLHHVHSVQWAYLQIWSGEPVEVPDLASPIDLVTGRALPLCDTYTAGRGSLPSTSNCSLG